MLFAWICPRYELATPNTLRDAAARERERDGQSGRGGGAAGERAGTMTGAVFNLSNTILGSGVIAMPYACRLNGCVWLVAEMVDDRIWICDGQRQVSRFAPCLRCIRAGVALDQSVFWMRWGSGSSR